MTFADLDIGDRFKYYSRPGLYRKLTHAVHKGPPGTSERIPKLGEDVPAEDAAYIGSVRAGTMVIKVTP